MGRGLQGALLRGFGGRDHIATVRGVAQVTARCLRITFSAPTVFEDLTIEPTAFLRFWVPDPDGGDGEFQRAYTIVWADPQTGELAVDFVLHLGKGFVGNQHRPRLGFVLQP